jgi:spore maturation protein CgeB
MRNPGKSLAVTIGADANAAPFMQQQMSIIVWNACKRHSSKIQWAHEKAHRIQKRPNPPCAVVSKVALNAVGVARRT